MFATSGNRLRLVAGAVVLMTVSGCGLSGSRVPVAQAGLPAVESSEVNAAAETGELRPEVPAAAALQWERAQAALRDSNWTDAVFELEQLVARFPTLVGPYVNLAIVYRQDGRDEEAEATLRAALEVEPNHPAANNELGMMLRERGEFEAAEAAYRRSLAGDPDYRFAHYNLGVLLDLYLDRRDEAVGHYETYQSLLAEPDQQVGFWIADLRRRFNLPAAPQQVAQEDGR